MRRYYGAGYDHARPSLFNVIAVVAACIAVALSVYVAVGRKPIAPNEVGRRVVTNPDSGRSSATPTPVATPSPLPTLHEDDLDSEPNPVAARPPACRSNCGGAPKRPSTKPGEPLRLDVVIFPANPTAGEEVTFTVTARDGDSRIAGIFEWFGDGSDSGKPHTACANPKGHAGWRPAPEKQPDSRTATFRHVYQKAGTFKAQFSAESGECGSAYAKFVTLPVEMVIEAAPSPAA